MQGGEQTTASTKATSAIDGKDQNEISCSVKPTPNGFEVNASLRTLGVDTNGLPVNPATVTLSTTIAADQTAPGTVTVGDNHTSTTYRSVNDAGQADATCTFSVHPAQPGEQLGVAAGRIWASFVCPKFKDPLNDGPNEMCAILPGHVALENCAQ
jgi:hypothetical protein